MHTGRLLRLESGEEAIDGLGAVASLGRVTGILEHCAMDWSLGVWTTYIALRGAKCPGPFVPRTESFCPALWRNEV